MATWQVHLKSGEMIDVEAASMVTPDDTVCFLTLYNTTMLLVPLDHLAYAKRKAECECCEDECQQDPILVVPHRESTTFRGLNDEITTGYAADESKAHRASLGEDGGYNPYMAQKGQRLHWAKPQVGGECYSVETAKGYYLVLRRQVAQDESGKHIRVEILKSAVDWSEVGFWITKELLEAALEACQCDD